MMKKWHGAIGVLLMAMNSFAQTINWQQKDFVKDSVYGISSEKALNGLLNKKKAQTIIVAIIDSGIDTLHEDLKSVLWTDTKTGIHGWNYIGAETGREDVTLLVADKKEFYDSLAYASVPEMYRAGYQLHRTVTPALETKIKSMERLIAELAEINTKDANAIKQQAEFHLAHGLNLDNLEADTAKGDADISPDKEVALTSPNHTGVHGTLVAGIVGSVHYGIAHNVQLMMLKTVGNIRELRDKSLAAAIRFAVDHGAKIINCSFGKPYTWAKKDVDAAIAYAKQKDVLVLHAAGNSANDNDVSPNYPSPDDRSNWLVVGASNEKGEATDFSNYGKTRVDVFAPGVNIYSTLPGNKYLSVQGTSMAAPVVAGVAAVIRGYYPKLTAVQVKEIMMKSVMKRDVLKDKCVSGGIINAYEALRLAATYK